jgi:hypothetical protein
MVGIADKSVSYPIPAMMVRLRLQLQRRGYTGYMIRYNDDV